jgi:hypothetical protein
VSFHSSPQKTRLRLFSEPGSGKSELGYETAIFFDGRTLRETGRIGSCGSRSDEAEASVNKTTPVPITPRGPVVTLWPHVGRHNVTTGPRGVIGTGVGPVTIPSLAKTNGKNFKKFSKLCNIRNSYNFKGQS